MSFSFSVRETAVLLPASSVRFWALKSNSCLTTHSQCWPATRGIPVARTGAVDARGDRGLTALEIARQAGHAPVVQAFE